MTTNKIAPGGNGVGSPRRAPALTVPISTRRASRQGARRPAEFFHAIDWGFVGFVVAVALTVFVVVSFALERAA